MAKQPEVTAATKKAFVDAFCLLYLQSPIEKITIQEITRKAGYNRSTFYQYFKDAYDLLNYLEDEIIASIKETLNKNLGQIDFTESFIQSFSNLQQETQRYAEVLLCNPQNTKFILRAKDTLMPLMLHHFKISENDEKAIYILEFYLAGVISIASRWFSDRQKISIEEIGLLIHTLLTEGVLSALGSKHKEQNDH